MTLPHELKKILEKLPEPILVGGCVRDHLLGLTPKDFDIEVHKTPEETLIKTLENHGKVEKVGASFGVYKLTTPLKNTYDFSLPRIDNKTGKTHKDFHIETNPNLSFSVSSQRRDLTINALGWNPHSQTLLDPFDGLKDLENKTLKHINLQFLEDPLRPLRLLQFSARFGFFIHPSTIQLCQTLKKTFDLSLLPKERIEEEFLKFLLKGKQHRLALKEFQKTGWLAFFPELEALHGLHQDPLHHPEGDVLSHTGYCLEALQKLPNYQTLPPKDKLRLSLATLCHDLGKATTTAETLHPTTQRITITSYNHQEEGLAPTKSLLKKLNQNPETIESVQLLVRHHMDHLLVNPSPEEVAKLAAKLSPKNPHTPNPTLSQSLFNLSILIEADHSGRPPKPPHLPEKMEKIRQTAKKIDCLHKPLPNKIQGKSLLELGFPQGKILNDLLLSCYDAFLEDPSLTQEKLLQTLEKNPQKLLKKAGRCPIPLITGKDLLRLGIPAGPTLGKTLSLLLNLQILGKLQSREDAIKEASNLTQTLNK